MTSDAKARARAALAQGDVLAAYDEAMTATEADRDDLDASYLVALALARSGARRRAQEVAIELQTRVEQRADASASLREDAAALSARLAKDDALSTRGSARADRLLHAAELYEQVGDRYGGSFACVNAATLFLLAGDRDRARALADRAASLVHASPAPGAPDYWQLATLAEAALIRNDPDTARGWIAVAAARAANDVGALGVTRRQLRLVCEATDASLDVLDALVPPQVLHFCGHRVDGDGADARFPAAAEQDVRAAVDAFFAVRRIGFGWGSLASGSDIVVAEALLDSGAQLHVVLPFAADDFERVSVAPSGPGWLARYRHCLGRATSVTFASDSAYANDDELFSYASRIAMGHALNRAAVLDAPAEQLAIWDRAEGAVGAGTAHDVAVWQGTGHPTHVIQLPQVDATGAATFSAGSGRRIGAILFSDLRGFSRLRDEHFPIFVEHVLAPLAAVLERYGADVWWRNSWGDAIAAVFGNVSAAADCALGWQDALGAIDLAGLGLPANLDLRIGGHAGPVMTLTDPVNGRATCWGRELTRAARIEPRTPEGEVYVTDAFAALLALEPGDDFASEYVGRITTAKDFETIPMYRLHRRDEVSARETS